jgi:hypothetical protein
VALAKTRERERGLKTRKKTYKCRTKHSKHSVDVDEDFDDEGQRDGDDSGYDSNTSQEQKDKREIQKMHLFLVHK